MIELGGKNRSMRVDGYAHILFKEMSGQYLIGGFDGSIPHIIYLLTAALKSGARFNHEEFNDTWIDVAQWYDLKDTEKCQEIFNKLIDLVNREVPEGKGEKSEKKSN